MSLPTFQYGGKGKNERIPKNVTHRPLNEGYKRDSDVRIPGTVFPKGKSLGSLNKSALNLKEQGDETLKKEDLCTDPSYPQP